MLLLIGFVVRLIVLRVLDLCSGIGGFGLGLERAGFEVAAFCEVDVDCREVLKKHWPDVPVYRDVFSLTAQELKSDGIGAIDVISGGPPCQAVSLNGKRNGAEDDRYLWWEVLRLVDEIRPTWCCFENVVGLETMGLADICDELERLGYGVQTFCIPAAGVGARHIRERLWILAYTAGSGSQGGSSRWPHTGREDQLGFVGRGGSVYSESGEGFCCDESSVGGRADGISKKLDEGRLNETVANWLNGTWDDEFPMVVKRERDHKRRIQQLGNAVVPQLVQVLGEFIMRASLSR